MTTIRYFVPEDGDLEIEPNVFLAPKSRHPNAPPSFGQVRDAFPLQGQYHFRFKSALVPGTDREKSAMAVWMDVCEERQPVPTWRGTIVAKVTRVSMEDDDDDDDDDDEDFHRPAAAAAPPVAATPKPPASVGSQGSIDDLFGSTTTTTPPPTTSAAATAQGSLLDFNDHQPQQTPAHNDFLGMTASSSGVQSAPASGSYRGNPNMYGQMQMPAQPMRQAPPPPQQQQQQFNSFSSGTNRPAGGAFGDLQWS